MGRLEGKVCIITGASSGIGAKTAEVFAKEGAYIIICARREELLKAVAEKSAAGCRLFKPKSDRPRRGPN